MANRLGAPYNEGIEISAFLRILKMAEQFREEGREGNRFYGQVKVSRRLEEALREQEAAQPPEMM